MRPIVLAALAVLWLAAPSVLRAQQVQRDCPQCPEMMRIPPGSFLMGTTAEEDRLAGVPVDRPTKSQPQHRIAIGYAWSLGKYEVTRGEFAAFVKATGRAMPTTCTAWQNDKWETIQGKHWMSPGFEQTDRHPVVCVTWDDARAYAAWLSRTTGKAYRLPTEAEWEYAARAGTDSTYYWGGSAQDACAYENVADFVAADKMNWARDSAFIFKCQDGYAYTAPVGSFPVNAFGLHDMLGNAWEWVEDCWNDTYAGAPTGGRAWLTGDCERHAVRGGSWYGANWLARSGGRSRASAAFRMDDLGFRVARTD